jgi:predicted Rossmann fold flavoprotein
MRIAIIGAGAAGCFAAANISGERGVEVVVFEKTSKVLQKVKVSGGGRCNVTHSCFDVPELVERYPRGKSLLKRSLYQFTPSNTIEWFGTRGVKLKTEQDGRMFPVTDNSQTIVDCLWQQMMDNDVQVRYNKSLDKIEKLDEGFVLHFADGTQYTADCVLIACGGYPKPEQYKWLTELGHSIQSPVPSLFTFNMPKHPLTELMGVSVPLVTVKIQGTKIVEQGPILITHWGLSGPVVLRASAWGARDLALKNYNFNVQVNWLNDVGEQDLRNMIAQLRRERGKQQVFLKNPFDLPRRLWEYILQQCGVGEELKWGDLPAAQQNKLVEKLVRDTYEIKGKTTFKEEFVTCGGISLSEIDAQTMQSKLIPGLYFAGEILDVDGITGGFNFQHAWSSGYIAAQKIVK